MREKLFFMNVNNIIAMYKDGTRVFTKNFVNFFLGQLLSNLGDAFILILTVALIMSKTGNPGAAIALVFFFFYLPSLVCAPIAGMIVDRVSRKKIMIISTLYRLGILLFFLYATLQMHVPTSNLFVYISFLLLGIGTAFFYPAKMAALPNIVPLSELKRANSLVSSARTMTMTAGAVFAGTFIGTYGILNCAYLCIACYVLAVIFIGVVSIGKNDNDKKQSEEIGAIRFLQKHKKACDIIGLVVVLSLINATFYSSMNAIATDTFNMGIQGLTKLQGLLGTGGCIGTIFTFFMARRIKFHKFLAVSFFGLAIAFATGGMCSTYNRAVLWLGVIGFFATCLQVVLDTIIQKATHDSIRGKVFAFKGMVSTFATLTGTLVVSLGLDFNVEAIEIVRVIAYVCVIMAVFIILFDKDFRYFLLKATVGQLFLCLFRYKVEGIENLPKSGKVIIAGNHTGHLDPLIIQMATKRQLWFVTGPAAFKVPIIKHLLKFYNVLPLQFGHGLDAIEAGVGKLLSGEAVVIFPEGRFTTDGNLCKFNRGVCIMAQHADCPIVPFAIKGGFETWGKGRKLPRLFNHIVIQFGQPVYPADKDEKETAKELQKRVNFIKHSLERRSRYSINKKQYSNFLELMQTKSDIYGQVKALSLKTKSGYEELAYIELSRESKHFANYLIESENVQRGERIAILSESRPEFGIGIFASIQTGAITVPLDVKLTVPEHTHILNDCNPRFLLCSSHYLEHAIEVKNNVPSIEKIFVLDNEERGYAEIPSVSQLEADIEKSLGRERSLDETALIVYTSGTTGNPKGVMISFGNIYSQLKDFEKLFKLTSKNTLLSILPINHLLELDCGFFGMLYMGAKIVYIKSLNPKELTTTMKEKQITNMIVVPLVAKMLKNSIEKQIKKQPKFAQKMFAFMYKLAKFMPRQGRRIMFKSVIDGLGGKFECFICGGAPLENEVAEFFERLGIPVFQGYGLTETSPTISTNRYGRTKLGTVGQALPSVNVKLAENGEILVSGSNVMQGYYNRPEATAEVIDEDGWFHTGDIGEIDRQGYIKITGRIKNMIVLGGGKKIFPEEVEAVLETSGIIKEVCVMSLKIKSGNKAGTEEVGAVIVPVDELQSKTDEELQKLLEDEVKSLSSANLAPYKTPTVVVLHREELPKTSTRKVKRRDLLQWYEGCAK